MFIGVALAMIEAHKFIWDEESELQNKTSAEQTSERERFLEHLNGVSKGGNI